jgi:hypothetical protein
MGLNLSRFVWPNASLDASWRGSRHAVVHHLVEFLGTSPASVIRGAPRSSQASSAATTFEGALDATRSGVALVDADLAIVHANATVRVMLDAGDPLVVKSGKLELFDKTGRHRRSELVRLAAQVRPPG